MTTVSPTKGRSTELGPSPEELALNDETVKVTIALSKTSVEFFKAVRSPVSADLAVLSQSPQG
jgi:hypothetical protein